jgi:hypothetical protein
MPPPNLEKEIGALQLSTTGLLRLLGGSEEDRERFWEIMKGITSRAEMRLAEGALAAANAELTAAHNVLAAVHEVARETEAVSA